MYCSSSWSHNMIVVQCPPFRLSYYGVGEPLLFIAFGPFSTIAFYLLHSITRLIVLSFFRLLSPLFSVSFLYYTDLWYNDSELPISSTVIWASILVGLTTSLILFCSHFHQVLNSLSLSLPIFIYIISFVRVVLIY